MRIPRTFVSRNPHSCIRAPSAHAGTIVSNIIVNGSKFFGKNYVPKAKLAATCSPIKFETKFRGIERFIHWHASRRQSVNYRSHSGDCQSLVCGYYISTGAS